MNPADKLWWEQMRAKGRGWYLLHEGILRYGVRSAGWFVLMGLVLAVLTRGIPSIATILSLALSWVVWSVFIGGSVGLALGISMRLTTRGRHDFTTGDCMRGQALRRQFNPLPA